MKGVIEFANRRAGHYALRTEDGQFTIFQMLSEGTGLNRNEELSGDLQTPGVQIFGTAAHGQVSVFVERTHCARAVAEAWAE